MTTYSSTLTTLFHILRTHRKKLVYLPEERMTGSLTKPSHWPHQSTATVLQAVDVLEQSVVHLVVGT
jgi:hypothetical protein